MAVELVELNDEEWIVERNSATQTFLGVDAETFAERYRNGEYDGDNEPDTLMAVLMYFPELD